MSMVAEVLIALSSQLLGQVRMKESLNHDSSPPGVFTPQTQLKGLCNVC